MTLGGSSVLLVGQHLHRAAILISRLHRWGFRCHSAEDLQTAADLLNARPVNLVLSNTRLPDGTGFGFVRALNGLPVSAFLCLPVEKSCFWLPAIDGGRQCLGLPALRPAQFARTLEEMAVRLGAPLLTHKPMNTTEVA